nr:hypothetical protein HK105_000534 [Polyrhizophydium stewartii]
MRESRYAKVAIVAGILILVIPALTLLSFLVLVWTGEAPYASVFKAVNQTVLQIATVTAAYITAHGIFGLWSVSRGSKRMMVWFAVLLVPTLAGQIALGYTSYKWINQPHFERRLTEQYQLMYTDETRQTIQTTVSLVVTCANFSSLTTLTVAQFNCCGLWSSFDYPVVDGVHCLQNLSPSQFNDTTGASGATGAAMAFYTMAFVHLAVTIVVFVLSVLSINRIE